MPNHTDLTNFKPLDIEKRKIHSERRRQDEEEALKCVLEAQQFYNCALIPSIEEGKFEMMIQARDPDSEETRNKSEAFAKYLQELCAEYQVEFMPVLNETEPEKSGVYLLTTW